MELRQLVYFDAVVREGGFGRAAAILHVAQPAVSVQIRKLETELGTTLLARSTRHVALTHAGELFLARARRVLAELDGGAGRSRRAVRRRHRPCAHRRDPGARPVRPLGCARRVPRPTPGRRARPALRRRADPARRPRPRPHRPGAGSGARRCPRAVSSPRRCSTTSSCWSPRPTTRRRAWARSAWPRCAPIPSSACRSAPGCAPCCDRHAAAAGFTPHVPFETTSLPRLRDLVAHGLGGGARRPFGGRGAGTAGRRAPGLARTDLAAGRPPAPRAARPGRRGVPRVPTGARQLVS